MLSTPCNAADEEPWSEVRGLADEAWFVDVDVDTAMARVAARQVSSLTSWWVLYLPQCAHESKVAGIL